MRIAVVGAGALGSVYALHLAHVAPVTLVVRDLARAPQRILAERVSGPGAPTDSLEAPPASTGVPADADVVVVALRVDSISDDLLASLAAPGPAERLVVVLTPLLPRLYDRVHAALGDRLVVGMPGVAAYEPADDVSPPVTNRIRYWKPRVSPTLLDARPPGDPRAGAVEAFAKVCVASELPCEVAANVRTTNPATTIAFFPLVLAIEAAGGSIERLVSNDPLLKLGLESVKESRALARTVGDLAGFASMFLAFAGPFTVRAGVKLARMRSPESLVFLEKHFGRKLRGQNRTMFREIEVLASERGVRVTALRRLEERAAAG